MIDLQCVYSISKTVRRTTTANVEPNERPNISQFCDHLSSQHTPVPSYIHNVLFWLHFWCIFLTAASAVNSATIECVYKIACKCFSMAATIRAKRQKNYGVSHFLPMAVEGKTEICMEIKSGLLNPIRTNKMIPTFANWLKYRLDVCTSRIFA